MLYGLVLHTSINMHGELHVSSTDVANFNSAFCQPTGGRNVSSNVTFNVWIKQESYRSQHPRTVGIPHMHFRRKDAAQQRNKHDFNELQGQ